MAISDAPHAAPDETSEVGDARETAVATIDAPRRRTALGILGLTLVLAVPLVVALVALREPRWIPLTDMAQYELFVRDVPSMDAPTLGLPGRIYGWGARGSHPGPIGFFMLWPLYALFGTDGWSLQVSAGGLVLVAAAVAIWMGYRRGGWAFALAVTAMLALLMRGFGATVLLEAWNPHLPIFWWVVFLLAVWGTLCRDTRLLPVVVFAGSVCAQTHISYVPLVGGLSLLVGAALVTWGRRAYRAHKAGDTEARGRLRHLLTWSVGSAALLVALWLLPLIEHVTHTPGNFSVIRKNFTTPVDDRLPVGDAVKVWLTHFDVTDIVGGRLKAPFPYAGIHVDFVGLGVLLTWAVAAFLAWRRPQVLGWRPRPDAALRRLHLVAGAAALLGLVGASRIIGPPWPYLTYWAWGTTATMILATVWTFLPAAGPKVPALEDEPATPVSEPLVVTGLRQVRPTLGVLAAITLVLVGLLTLDAPDTEMDEPDRSAALGAVMGPTSDRLTHGSDRCNDDCRVLVTWTDEVAYGLYILGVVGTLEGDGIDARALPPMEHMVGDDHRVTRRSEADYEVHLAVGDPAIDRWRRRDDAELVASDRPRPGEVAEPIAIFLVDLDRTSTDRGPQDADA